MSLAIFVLLPGQSVSAQTSTEDSDKIVAQIMKLESQLNEAAKKQNFEESNRLQADDFMRTWRLPPQIQTKSDIAARLKDPNFKRATIDSLVDDDVKVRVYNGDTAIATGHWKRVSRDADGKDTSGAGRFTRVWVKQNGQWRLAAAHYSPDIDLEKLKAEAAQAAGRKN
jgi:ketosteroid isomerase-like protein